MAFCWHHGIVRWDTFLDEIPAYVWDGWERWMEKNPDDPARRDQLACDIGSLLLHVQGAKIEAKDLMHSRLRPPYRGDRP